MLMAVEEEVKVSHRVQLTFDFVSPEEVRQPRLRRRQKLNVKTPPQAEPITDTITPSAQQEQIKDVCLLLHELARKYIPPTEFRDYTTFSRCSRTLFEQGTINEPPLELNATIKDHDAALITHAPQYRLLRNRAIAGLATVADLGFKAPAKGSLDYQKGMRDAYHHASDIAAMFLEDIQNGV